MTSLAPDDGPRPHILLVMADQWPAAALGCYGSRVPSASPNLDALAARGVVFDRHYTPIPLCGPSRAAMFTGRSPLASGVVANDIEARPDTPFVSQALSESGYRTWGVGKFHVTSLHNRPPTDLSRLGFDDVLVTEDPKHGSWLEWVRQEHPDYYEAALAVSWPMPYLQSRGPGGTDLRPAWEQARRRYLEPLQAPPYRRIAHPSPLPAELHQTTWVTDRALDQLGEVARRGEPAFTFVSYVDPHDPYDPPQPWWSALDPGDVPPAIPQEWTREWCPWQYAAFQDTRFELSTFEPETWAMLRAAYFGSARFVDDQIGRLLRGLHRLGLQDRTLVIATSDHGDMVGDHGLLMKGPWHYDATIRCPMILAGPGVAVGRRFKGLTSHLDVAPTLLRAAQIDHGATEGRALPIDPASLAVDTGHERLAIETNTSYVAPADPVRTVVTRDGGRLTVFPGQRYGELFELSQDPTEQHNRYRDPGALSRRLELTEELVAAMAEPALLGRRLGSTR